MAPPKRWPGFLLIGGGGRNSGKTRLSCSLIEQFSRRVPVVGLKVTAIKDRDGPCPRGNDDGCGVCSTVDENFLITEEKGLPVGKDTSLMVESGAVRVYWMRVLHEHLAEGVAELMRRVGSGAICIGESNSLRTVVEPDLFIIARDRKATSIKPSSRAVLHLAHRVVLSDTRGVDISLDDFDIEGGEWTLS